MLEKKFFQGDWIWDEEIYPNVYSCAVIYANGKGFRVFEISDRKNEVEELLDFMRKVKLNNHRLVGFNSVNFDYPVLHYILTKSRKAINEGKPLHITAREIYDFGIKIITSQHDEDNKFGSSIRDKDVIIKQVDLYLIHHFNNVAKATSLKMLEVNMRSENVEDLPFPVGKVLTNDEIDTLLVYNKHDVMETLKFYYYSYEALQLRVELSEKFGFDCTNFSDSKIGETLFVKRLEEQDKNLCYTYNGHGGRKINQTKRSSIAIKECLFDYLTFNRPEFKAVHDWISEQVVKETKGVFNDYEEHQIGELAKYAQMKTKKVLFKNNLKLDSKGKPKAEFDVEDQGHMQELQRLKEEFLIEHPCGTFEEVEKKTAKIHRLKVNGLYRVVESINTVVDGEIYVYGTGGIHMSVEGQIVQDDENWKIIDADVTSMYPSISIANNVYPEHLGLTFCKVYKDLFTERGKYPKGSGPNGAIKLALNSVYGKSNSEFSPLYDPKYTLTITVNGQLSLSMLAEQFLDIGCKIIQCNTDGVTALVPRDKEDQYYEITKQWEKTVGLKLEYAVYKMMALADVNNYLAVYEDGKVKSKGRYEVAHYEKLGWSKNHSAMIVAIAAMEHIVNGVHVEKTIHAHKDEFDFLLRAKIPRSSKLYLVYDDGREVKQQNICRYYPSEYGGKLVKLMPGLKPGDDWRRLGIDTEYLVETCNNIKEFDWNKLNYEYYVKEAKKLVTAVGG